MKTQIEELAFGTADVTVITPKIISTTIEEIRRDTKIWGQFFKTNKDLMANGGSEVVFPKKQVGISVTWNLSPGSGPTQSTMTYDATTIAIKKGGMGLAIQNDAVRQANRDVIADHIAEAGLVWTDTLDLLAMEAMFPNATIGAATTLGLTITLATAIPIGVKATFGDFSAANIVFSTTTCTINVVGGTLSYWYCPVTANSQQSPTLQTTGRASVSPKDVLLLRSKITADKYKPDVMIMHPDMFADLIYDPSVKFIEKSAYEGQGVIFSGELGSLWGMKVITSILCPAWAVVMVDTKNVGYEIIRKELDLKRDEWTGASADVLYFWGFGERNFGVVNRNAYGVAYPYGTITSWAVQGSAFAGSNP